MRPILPLAWNIGHCDITKQEQTMKKNVKLSIEIEYRQVVLKRITPYRSEKK